MQMGPMFGCGRVTPRLPALQDLNKFPFELIKKWLPASLRSRNPGSDDCLDLQIETDRGPRDLRMRCASPAVVRAMITELRDTVMVGCVC